MKQKQPYETPEVDLLKINVEVNFCESGDIPDYDPLTPPGGDMFNAPGLFDMF